MRGQLLNTLNMIQDKRICFGNQAYQTRLFMVDFIVMEM